MREKTARQTALEGLLRVEKDKAYSNLTLDTLLRNSRLSERDQRLAAMLFYGVLEHQMLLDYNIAVRANRPLGEIDCTVRVLLRMGLFQLYQADSIPTTAAVNETVKLCKDNGYPAASGFVNALLRKAAAEPVRYPDPKKGRNKHYAVRYSCPEPIVRLWRESYGDDNALGLLQSLADRPPLYVRVNTLKNTAAELIVRLAQEGVHAAPSLWDENALTLTGTRAVEKLTAFREGRFHVQDLASQLCCRFLAPQAGEVVLDACAAPGGKSFTCAEYMNNRGRLVACDLYEARVGLIRQGAQRLGIGMIETQTADAAVWDSDLQADRVLCDVPCSGLGILRRKPELRYKDALGLDELPAIQYRILCHAATFVKHGGMLLYSTCTLHPRENNDNARRFLAEHEEFMACPLKLPDGMTRAFEEHDNELTLMPPQHQTDGFFISLFQRK